VQEAPVTGYTATYNGLNIVNQLTNIEVRFVEIRAGRLGWMTATRRARARIPSRCTCSATVRRVDSRVVTGADGWAYSFGNLPDLGRTDDGVHLHRQ
jgi:hypothetical protein